MTLQSVIAIMAIIVPILAAAVAVLTKVLFDHRSRIVAMEVEVKTIEKQVIKLNGTVDLLRDDIKRIPDETTQKVINAIRK